MPSDRCFCVDQYAASFIVRDAKAGRLSLEVSNIASRRIAVFCEAERRRSNEFGESNGVETSTHFSLRVSYDLRSE